MLEIRSTQLLPFMQPLLDWTVDYVKTSEAQWLEGWSEECVALRVRFCCESALAFGITEELLILRIVVLLLELGPALNRAPELRAILRGPGSQQQRIDALLADPTALDPLRQHAVATRWNGFDPRHDLPTDD